MKTRSDALQLLKEWVSSESLRRHCLAVASAMEAYAIKNNLSENEIEKWFIAGLLHDFDWEKYPIMDRHPFPGCEELEKQGYDAEIIEAIKGHNYYNPHHLPRNSLMAKTLFAVDELCGLIVALAKVKPDNFASITGESVEKAMKKKDFAKAISREDIELGIKELGVNRKGHFEIVISALNGIKKELGF